MLKYLTYDIVFQEVPNEVSLAIYISNCGHHCPNCHSPALQRDGGANLDREELEKLILKYRGLISCILFMGDGQDLEGIEELCLYVKMCWGLKTALYTGADSVPAYLYKCLDYLKVGPYIEARGGLDHEGTNQRFFMIQHEPWLMDCTGMFKKKLPE